MKLRWKRLLALMMTASMLLPSLGLSEEIIPDPEVTVESIEEVIEITQTDEVPAEEIPEMTEQESLPELLPTTEPESTETDAVEQTEQAERSSEASPRTVTLQMLAEEYGYEVEVLEEMLIAMGVEVSDPLTEEEAAEIEAILASGMNQGPEPTANPSNDTTLSALAEKYGYEVEVLEEMLIAMGFELSDTLTEEEAAEIEAILASGMNQGPEPTANPSNDTTLSALAEKYGYEVEVLEEMLIAMGIELSDTLTEEEVAEIEAILASGMDRGTVAPTAEPTPEPTPIPTPNPDYPYNNIKELLTKRGFTMEYLMLRTGLSEEELTALSPELLTELDNMIRGVSHNWPYPTPTPKPTATPTVPPVEQTTAAELARKYGITASQLAKLCEMSVADLNALSPESLQELELALDLMADAYDSVDDLAEDMGFTVAELAQASGMSEQELRAMTPIQVMAIFVDIAIEPTYRYKDAYELSEWYGMSLTEIGSYVGMDAYTLKAQSPESLEEIDAKLQALGVKPRLNVKTAEELAAKYDLTVAELAGILGVEEAFLKGLSPEAITELDAALREMDLEPKVEFATAQEVAQKHGMTIKQMAAATGYTESELLYMSPDRLKDLDELLTELDGETGYMFKDIYELVNYIGYLPNGVLEKLGIPSEHIYFLTPEQLQQVYDYIIANEEPAPLSDFQIENGVLTGYTGTKRNIVIPDSVTAIAPRAFEDSDIITVKFTNNLTSIGEYAFYNCRSLTEVYIPDSVTFIGEGAFAYCDKLTSARLPSGLTKIPVKLMEACNKLMQVNIPSGVTEIGDYAFDRVALRSINLPKGLKKIGKDAVTGSSFLHYVTLPNGLESIGEDAFEGNRLREISIPDTVTHMGEGAFRSNELRSVKLPANMTTIPAYAFQQNDLLEEIVWPKNVQVIGSAAFGSCSYGLREVIIPKTVTRIEEGAFANCRNLEAVSIPSSVKYIHDGAFYNCDEYKLVLLIPKQDKFIDYCNRNGFMYYYNDRVSYIEYAPAKITLMAGEKHDPLMYVDFEDVDTITYTTSNKKVATVDSKGVITAKAGGTAKITAKSKKGGAKATLTVTVKTAPSSVKLNKTTAEMAVDGTLTLKAAIPANSETQFSWTSSNPEVASVNRSGVVTAKTTGETTVTVTTSNGKKASCAITVRTAPTALYLDESASMGVGQTVTLKPVIEPEFAFQGMSYASSDESVVQVSSAGKLTAKKAGTAVITATTDNGLSREMTVTVLAAPTKVKLNVTKVTMGVGQTGKLTASVSPEGAHNGVTYSTSNAKVVSVDKEGNVTALKTGSATITAKTYNGKKTTCKITVQKAPSSIKLNNTELTLGVGEERKLTATITKKTAASISWTTSDETVVAIDKGEITAVGIGTATITAETHNGKRAACTVTVKAAPTAIQLSSEDISLSVKQTAKLGVTQMNGESTDCAGAYTFKSSNTKIVTVNASGTLTAVKAGTATITVKSYVEGVSAECKVTVFPLPSKVKLGSTKATLGAGETLQLEPSLSPASSLTSYTFTSSKSSVAKVDQNGLVTAVKPGSATITVKTHNGKKATCKITVKAAPTSLVLSAAELTLGVGQEGKLSASINKNSASALKVTISDESILSRSGTTFTAKAVGTAVVTVETFNGLKKTCTVTVKPAPTELVIEPSQIVLSVKQTADLDVTMLANGSTDCAGALSYKSSSEKIVTVSASGKLTAKRAGTATITVRSHNEEVYAECKVRVVAAPSKVTLNKKSAKLEVGQTLQLVPEISPASSPATLTYTSSKPSVAMVNADGTVTAMKAGTATITVKTHNGKKATCKITVSAAAN